MGDAGGADPYEPDRQLLHPSDPPGPVSAVGMRKKICLVSVGGCIFESGHTVWHPGQLQPAAPADGDAALCGTAYGAFPGGRENHGGFSVCRRRRRRISALQNRSAAAGTGRGDSAAVGGTGDRPVLSGGRRKQPVDAGRTLAKTAGHPADRLAAGTSYDRPVSRGICHEDPEGAFQRLLEKLG